MEFVDMESVTGYHFNNSRESREAEGAPGSGFWYLDLGLALSDHSSLVKTPGHPPERWKKKEPTCKTGT
jgi:hypothetical protein